MTKLYQAAVYSAFLFFSVGCSQESDHQRSNTSVENTLVVSDEPAEIAEEEAVTLLDQFARETLQVVSQKKQTESEQNSVDELENLSEADRQALQDLVADEATDSAQQQATTEVERVKANKNIEQILRELELNE